MILYFCRKTTEIFSERKTEDSTQLISTLKATNLVNIVSMLYGMLHKDASTPVKSIPLNTSPPSTNNTNNNSNVKKQTDITLELTTLGVKLLNQMIILDLNMVQVRHRTFNFQTFFVF